MLRFLVYLCIATFLWACTHFAATRSICRKCRTLAVSNILFFWLTKFLECRLCDFCKCKHTRSCRCIGNLLRSSVWDSLLVASICFKLDTWRSFAMHKEDFTRWHGYKLHKTSLLPALPFLALHFCNWTTKPTKD